MKPRSSGVKVLDIRGLELPPPGLARPILATCPINCQRGIRGDFVLALLLGYENSLPIGQGDSARKPLLKNPVVRLIFPAILLACTEYRVFLLKNA